MTSALLAAMVSTTLPAETVSVPFNDGALHGELVTTAQADAADGIVLIVHGTMASNRMELIQTLQTLLAERGVNSLAITLDLGEPARTGMRDCSITHRHRHEDAQAEIAAWMNWLRERGMGTVTLLGHSRGGNQAAVFAAARSAPLRALVLVAPATWDRDKAARAYADRYGQALAPLLERVRALPPDTLLEDVPFLYCGPSRVSAASFLSYHDGDPSRDTPSLLESIDIPTLVVAGGADSTVPDVVEKTAPHVDANTQLRVIDGADHAFRDFYAEDLADAVAEFLVSVRP